MARAMRMFALLAVLAAAAAAVASAASFTQTVARSLDVTSQLVRETATVTLEFTSGAPVTTYDIATPDAAHLAAIQVKTKAGTALLPLTVTKTGADGAEAWQVRLETPLAAAGDKAVLVVALVYINKLVPVPARIGMLEAQFVRLDHSLHFYSPYATAKSRTVVAIPQGAAIKGRTEGVAAPSTVDGAKITYGPFTDVPARDFEELFVHFENNAPFAAVTRLVRTLEVSHWGDNLAVQEFFDVEHKGAALDGQFSRLDLMRSPGQFTKSNHVASFTLPIPITATEIYYNDLIGNISTSTLRPNLGKGVTNLILEPRYPIFGGWKITWFHGWNEPLQTVLSARTDKPGYVLRVPLATLFDNAAVEHFSFRVTLPEGAHNIELHSDVTFDDIHFETIKTYLDSTGRPILVASRSRFTNDLNGLVYVTYELPSSAMLNEPLLLAGFFLLLFVTGMIYVRIDLTIAKDGKADVREKVEAILYRVLSATDVVYGAFDQLDSALEEFKANKDANALKAVREKVEPQIKRAQDALAKHAAELQALEPTTSSKVNELGRLLEERYGKVKRLHSEVQNAKAGGKDVGTPAVRALEQEVAALVAQTDTLVTGLDD